MRLSVKVFLATAGDDSRSDRRRRALNAFHRGLLANSLSSELVDGYDYVPCDIAVLFGTSTAWPDNPRKRLRNAICSNRRIAHISIETPFFGRTIYRESQFQKILSKMSPSQVHSGYRRLQLL